MIIMYDEDKFWSNFWSEILKDLIFDYNNMRAFAEMAFPIAEKPYITPDLDRI